MRLGYADEAAAHEALVAIPEADRTFGQTNFLKAFTNVGFVESEGSFGLHNWDYSREIVNVALLQAKAVQAGQPEPRKWVVSPPRVEEHDHQGSEGLLPRRRP